VELFCIVAPPSLPYFFGEHHFEWFLGMLAAETMHAPRWASIRVPLAIAGLGGGLLVTLDSNAFVMRNILISAGFLGLMMIAIRPAGDATEKESALMTRLRNVAKYIGTFSYSLYLVHLTIITVVWSAADGLVARGVMGRDLERQVTLIAVPMSFAVGHLMYRYFERPYLPDRRSRPRP
jgi:peptidoglycan/LPS O-acetylase OafA/YrhL